jgi:hypothetical protein
MISGTEGGPRYMHHEPHKGVFVLNWLMIGNGKVLFFFLFILVTNICAKVVTN